MEKLTEKSFKNVMESNCPIILEKYKVEIMSLIEDYIYMPYFFWFDDFVLDRFNNSIRKDKIDSEIVLDELEKFNNIFLDIYTRRIKVNFDLK